MFPKLQHLSLTKIILVFAAALTLTTIWIFIAQLMTPGQVEAGADLAHPSIYEFSSSSTNTLIIATDPNYWPFEYYSGTQIIGHDIDLMDAIAAEINATVVYSNVSWGGIFTGLIAGDYDAIISGVTATPERDELLDFTLPYLTYEDGSDIIAIAVQQGDHDLRRQFDQALWQLREDGTLTSIITNISSDLPDVNARLPEWPIVLTDTDTSLTYPSSDGTFTTSINIPSEAVPDSTVLAYSIIDSPTLPSNFQFVGQSFNLDVYQEGAYTEGFVFQQPITVTLYYHEDEISKNNEQWLTLNYWSPDLNQWVDAANTCEPASLYHRVPEENRVSIAICHLSEFAFLAQTEFYIQLPLILRLP